MGSAHHPRESELRLNVHWTQLKPDFKGGWQSQPSALSAHSRSMATIWDAWQSAAPADVCLPGQNPSEQLHQGGLFNVCCEWQVHCHQVAGHVIKGLKRPKLQAAVRAWPHF